MPNLAKKIVLVGEGNPYGGDPEYALYPYPDGCSGHRLCCMILGMRRNTYLDTFDRINLCAVNWSIREARRTVEQLKGRYVVLMGKKVCTAYDVPFVPFDEQYPGTPEGGGGILVFPHPSGHNRMWAQAGIIGRARNALITFAPHLENLIGVDDAGE